MYGTNSTFWRAFALLSVLAQPLLVGVVSAQSRWEPEWKCMRKVTVQKSRGKRAPDETAYVEFATGGFLRPDGGDVRVSGKGKSVPHQIVFVGPGDRVSLLFKVVENCDSYMIQYGNPDAKPVKTDWIPKRGLIMETRRYTGGGNRNWKEMEATLTKAQPVYGRGLVGQVWHGYNPFGPSRNIVTIYRGWLNAPRAGTYQFVTSSAAASFMRVDDKMAVQWPGWHGAVGDARIRRDMKLTAGLHKFEYYHVQRNANPIMVAAWRPPGAKKVATIPPQAFRPPLRCKLGKYRVRGESFAAGFSWRNVSEAVLDGRHIVTMEFIDGSFPYPAKTTRREWHFGDGVVSKQFRARHVYLVTGTYTATLKIFRGRHTNIRRQQVVVDRDWTRQHVLKPEPLKSIAKQISKYPVERMSGRALCGMVLLYKKLGRTDDMLRVGKTLYGKLDEVSDKDVIEAAVAVGSAWRDKGGSPAEALKFFRRAEAALENVEFRARIAILSGDTLFHFLNKPASARTEYERVVKKYSTANEHVRMAMMRLGDVARQLGQLEEAHRHYEMSLEHRPKRAPGREAMDSALRSLETEYRLRRGELDAAMEVLHLWQWQYPIAKLQGHWSSLRIRLAIKRNQWEEAAREAEILLLVNPESQFAPEILLLLADVRSKQGEPEKAREALLRVTREYADSPLAEKAAARLKSAKPKKDKP